MSVLRPLLWLSGSLLRRLLREGVVLRSLLTPPILMTCLIIVVLSVFASQQRLHHFAVDATVLDAPALVADLRQIGVNPIIIDNAEEAVANRTYNAGTDGHTLWTHRSLPVHTSVEGVLRERVGARWRPLPRYATSSSPTVKTAGRTMVAMLTMLYTLYAMVFAAAAVVRDRDEGTLEVELSLPVPIWVHGAARLLTAWAVVGGFTAYGLLVICSIYSLPELPRVMLHAISAVGTASAVGLIAASWRSARGFSAVLAVGTTGLTALIGLGFASPPVQPFLPIASLFTQSAGWSALALALLTGALAVLLFTRNQQQ